MRQERLGFLQKPGFEHHRAAAGAAFNFGGAGGEATVFDQRAALEREQGALHFEALMRVTESPSASRVPLLSFASMKFINA